MVDFADSSNVCMSAVFVSDFCCCRQTLAISKYSDIFEELLSAVCISLSTETGILSAFLLLGIAACRSGPVAVIIDRVSAVDARVRRRAAGGGALMTSISASPPRGATEK